MRYSFDRFRKNGTTLGVAVSLLAAISLLPVPGTHPPALAQELADNIPADQASALRVVARLVQSSDRSAALLQDIGLVPGGALGESWRQWNEWPAVRKLETAWLAVENVELGRGHWMLV